MHVGHMPNLVGSRYSLKRSIMHSLNEILEEVDETKIVNNSIDVSIRFVCM